MKTKIAVIALAISAFFIVGCAGTPVSVNRFGSVQPNNINQQGTRVAQSGYTVAGFGSGTVNLQDNPFGFSGFNNMFGAPVFQDSLTSMTHFPLFIMDNSISKFVFNNYWSNQHNIATGSLLNPDFSITLFSLGNVQFKLMPAIDGRF